MKMFFGWCDNKFVLLVQDEGKLIARISMKKHEVLLVRDSMNRPEDLTTNCFYDHEQIV